MRVGELLYRVAQHGVALRRGRTEDRLYYSPKGALPAELVTELKEHKADVIKIMREDEEMRQSGRIQTQHQVFELAREFFGDDGKGGND